MQHFTYQQGELFCESVRVADAVERFGTPLLLYSASALRENRDAFAAAFAPLKPRITPAVKAFGNITAMRALTGDGSGLVAFGGAELEKAWLGAARFEQTVFAGAGKSEDDIRAALDGLYSPLFQTHAHVDDRASSYRGPVGLISADSPAEVERIAHVAGGLRINCRVLLRVNPEIDPDPTREELLTVARAAAQSKLGMTPEAAMRAAADFADRPSMKIIGLHMHLGASIPEPERFQHAALRMLSLLDEINAAGHTLDTLDLGGGFVAQTGSSDATRPADYADALVPLLEGRVREGLHVIIEPGRAIAASAGVLITRVLDTKQMDDRRVLICDTGLNPSGHAEEPASRRLVWPIQIEPGNEPPSRDADRLNTAGLEWFDAFGPNANDADAIALGRMMPPAEPGACLAIFNAGAYPHRAIPNAQQFPPAQAVCDQYACHLARPRPSSLEALTPDIDAAGRPL